MFTRLFRKIATVTSHLAGAPATFLLAILIIFGWLLSGPIFQYSNTWQLAVNTGTTIITFLMVFLIQNTQNRETKATQIKLDELLLHMKGARNSLVNIEEVDDEELERLQNEYKQMREKYQHTLEDISRVRTSRKPQTSTQS